MNKNNEISIELDKDKINILTRSLQELNEQLEKFSSIKISNKNINKIISIIVTNSDELNMKEKVKGFEDYLKKCSNVYSKRDYYTGDYAYAVDEVLHWYNKWFGLETEDCNKKI